MSSARHPTGPVVVTQGNRLHLVVGQGCPHHFDGVMVDLGGSGPGHRPSASTSAVSRLARVRSSCTWGMMPTTAGSRSSSPALIRFAVRKGHPC